MEKEKKLLPNTTQIPNILFDKVIPGLPEGEAKCLLYICRRTYGFHKSKDRISFSQFVDGIKDKDIGAGVSRPVVAESLRNLIGAGVIIMQKTTKGNIYEINLEMDFDKVVKKVNQLRKLTKSSKDSLPKQVKFPNLQKKGKKGNKDIYNNLKKDGDNLCTNSNIKLYGKISFRGMPVVKDRFTGKMKALDEGEWKEIDRDYLSEVKIN